MKALSIRQPWAWLILNAGKDIENRDWPTHFRGRFLIHASKGMTHDEYEGGLDTLYEIDKRLHLCRHSRFWSAAASSARRCWSIACVRANRHGSSASTASSFAT
jgi:hypothetical protein